jgi:hypothetical protein
VTAGQRQASTQCESVMNAVRIPQPMGRPRTRPCRVAGDKGDSVTRMRTWLRQHGIGCVMPQR